MKRILFLVLILTMSTPMKSQIASDTIAAETERPFPKIGLVLSGGGARGLAHISVLRALDSAGLRVDYVTGTSIGAVMGSLYAAGYSGNFIDSVAAKVDWDKVLTDEVPLPMLSMQEKDMARRNTLDLPYINRKFTTDRSIMEGQGIWNKFTDFLFPVMGINDFDQLDKPFRAVAADITNGKEVVLSKGSLLDAVRASMAVPAAFSPVEIDGRRLIDGGVTRNLPVQDVIDLGAEYVIGIDLNKGGDVPVNYDNPMQLLLNVGFYCSDADFKEQKKLCDYSFSFNLRKYGAGDFGSAKEITEIGYASLDSLYHHFVRIKDELEKATSPQKPKKKFEGRAENYKLDRIRVRGIAESEATRLEKELNIDLGSHYSREELRLKIDRVFGSNRYKSLHFNLYNLGPDSYEIEFVVVPKSKVYLSLGLQYNEFERINLISQIYMHDILLPRSKTVLGSAIGQNLRLRAEHYQSINQANSLGLHPYYYLENITLQNRNKDFDVEGQYRQHYYKLGMDLLNMNNPKWQIAAGWKLENIRIDPYIFTNYIVDGRSSLQSVGLDYNRNTLNEKTAPTRGTRLHARLDYIYHQNPKMKVSDAQGTPLNLDSLGFGEDPYFRLQFEYAHYFPLHHHWTLRTSMLSQNNISFQQNLVDNYLVGGMQKTFRNQCTFVGLDEADIYTTSYSGVGMEISRRIWPNASLSILGDVGVLDYLNEKNEFTEGRSLAGFGGQLSYHSFIGPINLAMTYNTYSQQLGYTLYLGVLF